MIEIKCAYDKIIRIEKLKPHPKNANIHSTEQIDRLSKIIQYQGIRRPIRVSKLSGYITAGHGLLEAARKLVLSTLPVNFQDYENEEQEYADIIGDNSIASWAELDLQQCWISDEDYIEKMTLAMNVLKKFREWK